MVCTDRCPVLSGNHKTKSAVLSRLLTQTTRGTKEKESERQTHKIKSGKKGVKHIKIKSGKKGR